MAKVKKGDLFSCAACGLIITVDEACGCTATELVCCNEPMAKGKAAAAKARKSVQAIKPAAVKKTAKAAAPGKTAATKPAAKAAAKKSASAKSKTAQKK